VFLKVFFVIPKPKIVEERRNISPHLYAESNLRHVFMSHKERINMKKAKGGIRQLTKYCNVITFRNKYWVEFVLQYATIYQSSSYTSCNNVHTSL
jgi:hypothetical protein